MKESKIIIGANYGDEGKGLATNFFCTDAKQRGLKPIIIFHNGTAQRGHTVDFTPNKRHVFHHFGSGTAQGIPTYFAETFFIHPMTYYKEYVELTAEQIAPFGLYGYCDPEAKVITPFDMLVDHATEEYIAIQHDGEREYGSCGLGSWCAIEERYGNHFLSSRYTAKDFDNISFEKYFFMMDQIWNDCLAILVSRKVNIDKLKDYRQYFTMADHFKKQLSIQFKKDLDFFFSKNKLVDFGIIYNTYDSFIFENGQGLGLDFNYDKIWHTTSRTGVTNPQEIFKDCMVSVDACYITRSYSTRHGVGNLKQEVAKEEINRDMFDKTNIHNDFQGGLRYGFLDKKELFARINNDWSAVKDDIRFNKKILITHCNEFKPDFEGDYYSYNPFTFERSR